MRFLIDHRGVAIDVRDPSQLKAGVSVSTSAHHVIDSGCIAWNWAPNAISIRFRPSIVSPSALARIERWLDCGARHRMHLAYWMHDAWHHEVLQEPRFALRRIETLVSFAGGGRYGHVARRMASPSDLEHRAFRDVTSLWRERKENFDLELFPLVHERMKGRATLFEADATGELHLVQPGEALTVGTRSWASRNPRLAVSQLPYYRSSAPVFDGLSQATASLCPVHDEIDGFFMWPGHTPLRLSYKRIVLPFVAGDKRWVVSTTISDRGVNLLP